jgi:DNA-binding response OmpR family regulator
MAEVVLIGKEWQARALVRAQLIEEGVDVEAFRTTREAMESLGELLPSLLVADFSESDDLSAEIDELTRWSRQIPIWIVAGRSLIAGKNLHGRGFEMILLRPIDVGELVDQIKHRLEEAG